MRRRTVLAMPLAAMPLAARSNFTLRLSVRVEPFFPGLTLAGTDQKGRRARAIRAFEFGDWRAAEREGDYGS